MHEYMHPEQHLQVIRQRQAELAQRAHAARLRRRHRPARTERGPMRLHLLRPARRAIDALGLSRHLHVHVPRHSGP